MDIVTTLTEFFKNYGVSFRIDEDTDSHFGIILPKSSKSSDFLKPVLDQIGQGIIGEYILLASPNMKELKKGGKILSHDKTFIVMNSDLFYLSNTPIYRYACLKNCTSSGGVYE